MTNNTLPKARSSVSSYAWVILVVVFLASVAAPLNQAKVPPLMPVLMDAFHLSLGQAGLLMSVFALMGLFLSLPTGFFLQKFGPKVVGMAALGCLVIGAVFGAFSQNSGTLLFSRVIEGAGMGLIAVVAPAVIAMWFPPEKQGIPLGIWATWVPVGSVTMYVLAPSLGTAVGWQSVWWIGGGFALVTLALYGVLLRLPPQVEKNRSGNGTPPNFQKALSNPMIWLLALEFCCFTLVLIGIGTYMPTFLSEVRGYPLAQASLIASISTFMVMISAPLAGWFSDRIGSRRSLFSIPFALIAVLLLFPFKAVGWQIFAFLVLLGFIAGAIPTATFAAAPELMGQPELAGLGMAVVMTGQNLGMFIGPILFGGLVERLGWVTAGYWLIPVCIVGFIAGRLVKVR